MQKTMIVQLNNYDAKAFSVTCWSFWGSFIISCQKCVTHFFLHIFGFKNNLRKKRKFNNYKLYLGSGIEYGQKCASYDQFNVCAVIIKGKATRTV